jgi:hypothetical protein
VGAVIEEARHRKRWMRWIISDVVQLAREIAELADFLVVFSDPCDGINSCFSRVPFSFLSRYSGKEYHSYHHPILAEKKMSRKNKRLLSPAEK